MDFILNFITFVLILLLTYMFFRLISLLYKQHILNEDNIFYITSNPWEYKIYKNRNKKKEGS